MTWKGPSRSGSMHKSEVNFRLSVGLLIALITGGLLSAPEFSCAAQMTQKRQAENLIKQGDQFYQDKQYEKAVEAYQEVLTMGFEGTSVYYNLGDAYYREGKLGYSILYYEKALRLSPGDPDIIHNLRIANSRTIDKIDALPQFFLFQWWEGLLSTFSTGGWARIAYAFYILLLLSIGLYFFAKRPRWQRYSFFSGLVLAVFLVVTASLWLVNLDRDLYAKEAIIVQPTVVVKLAPDPTSNDAFIIHQGLKVREMNNVGDWIEIRLQDGKVGWVHQSEIGTI